MIAPRGGRSGWLVRPCGSIYHQILNRGDTVNHPSYGPARRRLITGAAAAGVTSSVSGAPFAQALNDLTAQGAEPRPGSASAFGEFMRSETQKWGKLVRDAGIRIE